MNTNLLIEEKYVENARTICNAIDDSEIRNRAVANVLAADISEEFFADSSYDIDTKSGLHSMGNVLEDIDISDIYVNGHYVDVRLYFDEREISVPKAHFDNDILPVAYMFIKVSPDLSSGVVTGFILPQDIDTTFDAEGFYPVEASKLKQFIEIVSYFMDKASQKSVPVSEIFNYTEDGIDEKIAFYRSLTHDYSGRVRLRQILKAQNIFNFISVNENYNSKNETLNSADFGDFSELLDSDLEEQDYNENELNKTVEYATEVSPSIDSVMKENDGIVVQEQTEQTIDNLFTDDSEVIKEEVAYNTEKKVKKRPSSILWLILGLLLLAAGYFGYTKYNEIKSSNVPSLPQKNISASGNNIKVEDEVMPVETIEKTPAVNNQNEGTAISIPAIEKNLDASILVTNLKIEWEVPTGYVSSSAAQKYLKKIGKIMYMNLKAELLLLNKPPITNRIAVELKYNTAKNAFEVEKIVSSSGESSVDNTILQTIKTVLDKKLSINNEIFEKLDGNPVLVIKL